MNAPDLGALAIVVDQIPADHLKVQHDRIMGPHLWIRVPGYEILIISEFDHLGMPTRATDPGWASQPWDALEGVVEMALLDEGRGELVSEPLRRVPFAQAAELLRRALACDVDAFFSEEP